MRENVGVTADSVIDSPAEIMRMDESGLWRSINADPWNPTFMMVQIMVSKGYNIGFADGDNEDELSVHASQADRSLMDDILRDEFVSYLHSPFDLEEPTISKLRLSDTIKAKVEGLAWRKLAEYSEQMADQQEDTMGREYRLDHARECYEREREILGGISSMTYEDYFKYLEMFVSAFLLSRQQRGRS